MSTVEEEIRSMHWAHKFFRDLMDVQTFPEVPRYIRNSAWDCAYNMEGVSRKDFCPELAETHLKKCRDLLKLLQDGRLCKVPPRVRDLACRISRHYPLAMRLELVGWRDTRPPEPLYEGGTIWA